MPKDQVLPDPVLAGGRNLDQEGTGVLLSSAISQRAGQKQRELKASSAEMQYPQPSLYAYRRDLRPAEGMQTGMRFLSGARETISPKTSECSATFGARKGGRGSNRQNQCHHPTGATAELLAPIELLHRKKADKECNHNPGGSARGGHCRAHNARAGRADNIFRDPQQEIHDGWRGPYMQRRSV
jgi:hypothetical protein